MGARRAAAGRPGVTRPETLGHELTEDAGLECAVGRGLSALLSG